MTHLLLLDQLRRTFLACFFLALALFQQGLGDEDLVLCWDAPVDVGWHESATIFVRLSRRIVRASISAIASWRRARESVHRTRDHGELETYVFTTAPRA